MRGQNSSSTSILVKWDEVPADQRNGIITGYPITYHSQTENDNGSVVVGPNDRKEKEKEIDLPMTLLLSLEQTRMVNYFVLRSRYLLRSRSVTQS